MTHSAALPAAVLPAAAALALAFAAPAGAQMTLLPDTGTTVQVGNLRQQLEGLLAAGTEGTPAEGWTFVPAVALEQRWTDHLQGVGSQQGESTFITVLRPSLLVSGQTARTTANLSYAPDLEYYSASGHQNRINQNLNAFGTAILVPEHLFIDLRGFAAMQNVNGGTAPSGTTAVSNQNEAQTFGYSIHPYLREHFGNLASAELGGTLSRTMRDNLFGSQSSGSSGQGLTTEQEYFSLSSGSDFGRFSSTLSLSANQSAGSGGVNDSRRDQAMLNLGYGITHEITLLGGVGYDQTHYGGIPPFNYSGMDWEAGLRWIPNPDSSITVTYGRQEGVGSVQLDASYAPTARSRVYARYSEGIATGLEQLNNAMNSSGVDASGNAVDRSNGTPVQVSNGFYGVQDNLSRVTTASLTATLLLERDAISASFSRQERHQLAATTTTAGSLSTTSNTTGYYGTLSWQRSLWPDLNATAFFQAGTGETDTGESGNSNTLSQHFDSLVFSTRLSYAVSETLSAYGQYSWDRQFYSYSPRVAPSQMLPSNLVIIGVSKVF